MSGYPESQIENLIANCAIAVDFLLQLRFLSNWRDDAICLQKGRAQRNIRSNYI